jgi:RNA 2',3'-cyclic 3'-phosphodiesterase
VALRVFVALDLPSAVRDALPVAPEPWRPVPVESLHVTLAFLGWVGEDALPVVDGAVAGAVRPVGPLRLVRSRVLPPRRPRVLSVELSDPSGGSVALQRALVSALSAVELYEPEHRRWLPHVTIGRARGPVDRRAGLPAVKPLEFSPRSVSVYRSHLGRGPARYEALFTHELPPAP